MRRRVNGRTWSSARGVGRPQSFGSGDEKTLEKQFAVWQRKLLNYVVSVFPDMKDPMEWAVSLPTAVTDRALAQAYGDEADAVDVVEGLAEKDHQLYSVLVQITEYEANDIVSS